MTNTMQYVLPRLLTGIFLALFHAWPFILLNDPFVGEGKDPKKPKYPPLLRSAQLLGMILTILLLGLLSGSSHEIQHIFLDFFLLFLTLSLYYALVLMLMPFSAAASVPAPVLFCGPFPIFYTSISFPRFCSCSAAPSW